jgi:hypothetical protein
MLVVLRDGHLTDGTPVQGAIVVNEDRLYRRAGDYERFVEALTFEEGRVFADARGEKDLYSDSAEVQGLRGSSRDGVWERSSPTGTAAASGRRSAIPGHHAPSSSPSATRASAVGGG